MVYNRIFLRILLIFVFIFSFGSISSFAQNDLGKNVTTIQINGTINPSTTDYIKAGLLQAGVNNSEALLILLDTPGGLLNSTKDIVKLLLNSEIPVIVYVSPKGSSATSAGVFITMAGNIAAMAPGTSIGAAHPVSIGGRNTKPNKNNNPLDKDSESKEKEESANSDIMGEKIENYAISFLQGIAEERGRNIKWAEQAVKNSDSITANEALKLNVIDIVSPNVPSLLNSINGKKVKVNDKQLVLNTSGARQNFFEMSLKQKIVNILSTPDIAFLLLSLGSLGILIEFYNPGTIFPGVAGLISLLIGFISLQILPFNYGGLALVFVGLGLFVAEVYVTSYGLLSLAGLISFIFGAILLFETNESDIKVGHGVIIATSVTLGLFFLYVAYSVSRTINLSTMSGFEGMVGETGEVISWDASGGKIYINGEYWDATSDENLQPGNTVKVVESKGSLNIKVTKI